LFPISEFSGKWQLERQHPPAAAPQILREKESNDLVIYQKYSNFAVHSRKTKFWNATYTLN